MALVGDAHIIEAWLGGKRLKIEGQLIYDIVLVSGIRQSDSVLCVSSSDSIPL